MIEPLDWGKLASYAATPFPPNWNQNEYVFFSPRDPEVHQAIIDVTASASHSFFANHYGFTDEDVIKVCEEKFSDPNIACILNLDKIQEHGPTEHKLIENSQLNSYIGTSIAVGQSIHHAISHLKVFVVDNLYIISGSTNMSLVGEQKQDNELRITRDPLMAARYSSIILLNHLSMLDQMKNVAA